MDRSTGKTGMTEGSIKIVKAGLVIGIADYLNTKQRFKTQTLLLRHGKCLVVRLTLQPLVESS